MTNTVIENTEHLLAYIISQADSGNIKWFSFTQQKAVKIYLAVEMARLHANTMTPKEVIDYVTEMNNLIYEKILRNVGKNG